MQRLTRTSGRNRKTQEKVRFTCRCEPSDFCVKSGFAKCVTNNPNAKLNPSGRADGQAVLTRNLRQHSTVASRSGACSVKVALNVETAAVSVVARLSRCAHVRALSPLARTVLL